MLKLHHLFVLGLLISCCACSSDKERILTYIENYHPDLEIKLEGDVTVDSAYCPLTALDSTSLMLMSYRMNLLRLLEVNPDSAFKLARQLNERFGDDNAFANIAYPKGPKNRLAYQVRCKEDGDERYLLFFKNLDSDDIEFSSIEVDEAIDSLMSSFTMLRNGLNIILNDSGSPAETKKNNKEKERKEEATEPEERDKESSEKVKEKEEKEPAPKAEEKE